MFKQGECHHCALNRSAKTGRKTLNGLLLSPTVELLSTHQLPMLSFSAVRPLNPPILGDFNSSFPPELGGFGGAMQQFVGRTGDGCT